MGEVRSNAIVGNQACWWVGVVEMKLVGGCGGDEVGVVGVVGVEMRR